MESVARSNPIIFLVGGGTVRRGFGSRALPWRAQSVAGLAVLALSAGTLEVFSMVPYLAAVGLLVSSHLPTATSVALLVAYCAVMVVPALALIAARTLWHTRIEPLVRIDGFLSGHADSATGWAIGGLIAG
jgi:hypothetical protein